MKYKPSDKMLTDSLIKALLAIKFEQFHKAIGVVDVA